MKLIKLFSRPKDSGLEDLLRLLADVESRRQRDGEDAEPESATFSEPDAEHDSAHSSAARARYADGPLPAADA